MRLRIIKNIAKKIFSLVRRIKGEWILLILFIICLILAIYIFYSFALNPKPSQEPISISKIKLKLELYHQVVNKLNQKEQNLKKGLEKEYRDIFR